MYYLKDKIWAWGRELGLDAGRKFSAVRITANVAGI